MAGYSNSEIETSVAGFVKSDIEVEQDVLGPTDVANKFNEVLQLISATLVFDPNAIFYLIFLATNRLNADVLQAIEYVDDILQAIDELGQRTAEVTRTTLLGDASAALLSVDAILSQNGVISNNAFSRYLNSVDSFIDTSIEPNIKNGSEIIRPPQEAQAAIISVLPTLSSSYENILATLEQIGDLLSEFNALDLPVLTIQDSVRKTRTDLQELQSIFEDTTTTRDDKIAECRDAYLRLISGKAVLNNLTTVTDPSEPRMQSTTALRGRAVEPLPELGELQPASLGCYQSAPWFVETGYNEEIVLAEDGNPPTTYTLVPPAFPSVENYKAGPFNIHGATTASLLSSNLENYTIPASPDNEFVIVVDGVEFAGNITAGVRTGAEVATDIGNILDVATSTILLSSVINVTYSGGILFAYPTAGEHSIVVGDTYVSPIPTTNVNSVIGFASGDWGIGQDANDQLEIDVLTPLVGLAPGAIQDRWDIANDINTWVAANYPGEYYALDDGSNIVIRRNQPGRQTIRMTAEAGVADDTVLLAMEELGFYEGQSDSNDFMSGEEVVDQINAVGKVSARIDRFLFEQGTDGTTTSGTTMTAPGVVDDRSRKTLVIRSGVNAGLYRILFNVGPALTVIPMVGSPDAFPDPAASNQSWLILEDRLVISSVLSTMATQLIVHAAAINPHLGLLEGTYNGTTTGFRAAESGVDANFVTADVVVGDILRIPGDVDRTIIERSADKQLEVTPPLDVTATNLDFQIISAAAIAYAAFIEAVTAWEVVKDASSFYEDLSELERVMNPLIVNKTPSLALLGDARTAANELRDLLRNSSPLGLADVLESFEVTRVGRMEASLNMLQERGLDRAYNYLLDGKISEFFGFDKDDAALSTYMLKTMRNVVQDDLPQSKLDEDADDIIHDELVVDTDYEYDTSDLDEDEGLEILGEVPDLTDEEVDGLDPEFFEKRY